MGLLDLWENFVSSGMNFSISDSNYRRVYLINTLSLVMILLMSFFVFYNLFVDYKPVIAILELITSIMGLFIILVLRKKNNIVFASYCSIIVMIVISLAIFSIKIDEYVLIFALLVPLTSYFLFSDRLGFVISFFYFLGFITIFSLTSIRNNILFELDVFVNLIGGYAAIFIVTHLYETSRKEVNSRLIKANEQLQHMAMRDGLTGLYNRRFFNKYFSKELNRGMREGKIFVFFMLDVDYFKKYNDTYGHTNGDEVLLTIANILVEYLRRCTDFVFRLGGEEYGGIIVEDEENKVLDKLQKIRQAIEEMQIPHASSKVDNILTVSIGAKIIKNYNNMELRSIFSECDQALYRAKQNGRNRIEVS